MRLVFAASAVSLLAACSPAGPSSHSDNRGADHNTASAVPATNEHSATPDPPPPSETLEQCRAAAESGDAVAMYRLGVRYRTGDGVEKDLNAAIIWFSRAGATKNDPVSLYELGRMYETGEVPSTDTMNALVWYQRAADAGHAGAMRELAQRYSTGSGVDRNLETAVEWNRRAAEAGDADAMNDLGIAYQDGRGVTQSDAEALKWFRKSAEAGSASGMFNLGIDYEQGIAVRQDLREAAKWYLKAAEGGHNAAMLNIGFFYYEGHGVQQSDARALMWFERAAKAGNVKAMLNLGMVCEQGLLGKAVDRVSAFSWYRTMMTEMNAGRCSVHDAEPAWQNMQALCRDPRMLASITAAAERGRVESMLDMAYLSCEGRCGVQRNPSRGLEWYERAAKAGSQDAMVQVWAMKRRGVDGIPRDDAGAAEALKKARDSGVDLSPSQRQWLAEHDK